MGRGTGPSSTMTTRTSLSGDRASPACLRGGLDDEQRRWVKVAADLENLTLRLDNRALAGSTRSRSSEVYNKEMQIHRARRSSARRSRRGPSSSPSRTSKAGKTEGGCSTFLTREAGDAWFDLLYKVATTGPNTLLEPLMEARDKRRDAVQLEEALAARPARVEDALEALRRGRLPADFVARDAWGRAVTALLAAARAGRADIVEALVALGARPDGRPYPWWLIEGPLPQIEDWKDNDPAARARARRSPTRRRRRPRKTACPPSRRRPYSGRRAPTATMLLLLY